MTILYKKRSFPLRISSVNVTKSTVTFTEEIFNGKLLFLCSVRKKVFNRRLVRLKIKFKLNYFGLQIRLCKFIVSIGIFTVVVANKHFLKTDKII